MAKAGIDKFVRAKISEMRKWISRRSAMIDEKGLFDGYSWRITLERDFSLGLFFDIGYEYQQMDEFDKAEQWYLRLINNFPDADAVGNAHYNLACLYSIRNEIDKALHQLDLCVAKGFLDFAWMEKDRDLDNVRSHPGYEELKQRVFESLEDDERNEEDGRRYYGIHDLIRAFVEDSISDDGGVEVIDGVDGSDDESEEDG
jgi:tetratricopeptide (TPR) repeat protein